MLNHNELKIAKVIQDKEILEYLNIVPTAIRKVVTMAKEELEQLDKVLNESYEREEKFELLYKRLKGENLVLDAKYPNYNCFSISYGSLYLTIEQPLDESNNKLKPLILKNEVSIYPDNVCDIMGADSLFTLNFNETIDFENINNYLRTQSSKEVQKLLQDFFTRFDLLNENSIDRIKYKSAIYNKPGWLNKDIDKFDYSDLLGCMLDVEDECYELINFSKNTINEINQFKSLYMDCVTEENNENNEEIEEDFI